MKQFFIMLMIAGCVSMLSATEAAVRKTVDATYNAVTRMDTESAAKNYHPKYVEKTSSGKTLTSKDIKKAIQIVKLMKKAIAENSTLLDIMEFMAFSRNTTVSDEQKQQIIAVQATEQGKQQTALIRTQLKMAYDSQLAKLQNSFKKRKITSCTVKGGKAVVNLECISPLTDKLEHIQLDLVKVKGKWLILKSTAK